MEKKVCDEIGNTPRKEHNIPKCETRQIPKIPAQDRVSCSLGKLVCPESRATYRSTAIFLFPTLGISRRGTRAPRNLTDLLSRLFIFETKRHGVIIIIAMDGVHGRKTQPVGSINSVFRPIVKMPDNGGIPGRNCGHCFRTTRVKEPVDRSIYRDYHPLNRSKDRKMDREFLLLGFDALWIFLNLA